MQIYLFDWGDTLMVDFPDCEGKMCDWEVIQVVDGAREVLRHLSQTASIYVATSAADSSEADIARAFERAGLAEFISGYFCKANVGLSKSAPEFYRTIVSKLAVDAASVTMVGDGFEKDIALALEAGLNAIWLNPEREQRPGSDSVSQITHLDQLLSG